MTNKTGKYHGALIRCTLWAALLFANMFALQGQNNKAAKKSWKAALSQFENAHAENCISQAKKAFKEELTGSADSTFLREAKGLLGKCYRMLDKNDSAIYFFYEAIRLSEILRDTAGAGNYIIQLNNTYAQARQGTADVYLQYQMGMPKTEKKYVMYGIPQMDTVRYDWRAGDTCWFICNGGMNDGIYDGAICGFYAIYKPYYRERPFAYLGEGKITYAYAQKSHGFFVFNDDFFDTIYVADGAYVNSALPKQNAASDIYTAATTGYSCKSASGDFYIHPTSSLYFNNEFYDAAIFKQMLQEIHRAATGNENYDGSDPDLVIQEGRFKGFTLRSALAQTTKLDVAHFINIPATYKKTYYNYSQNLLFDYIWWLTHTPYTGANQSILWKAITQTPENQIATFAGTYGFYFDYWDKLDSIYLAWTDTIAEESYAQRKTTAKKMLAFARQGGNQTRQGKWLEKLTLLTMSDYQFQESDAYTEQWIKTEYNKEFAWLYGAFSKGYLKAYALSNSLCDSVLNNEPILGLLYGSYTANWMLANTYVCKAWNHLIQGQVKTGLEFSQKALELDSWLKNVRNTYGHALALSGDYTAASKQYDIALDMVRWASDIRGTMMDFDQLIQNGVMASWFSAEKKRIHQLFYQKYYHKLVLDSMLDMAALQNKTSKNAAFLQYTEALSFCKKYLPADSSQLIFILDWLGYLGIEIMEDSLSLEYYIQALEVCKKFNFSSEKILFEYDNITYTANLVGNTSVYRHYTAKMRELKQEINRQKSKKLYVLACGTNTSNQSKVSENFAEKDALSFCHALQKTGRLYYDSVVLQCITGEGLTLDSLIHSFKSISEQAGENDAFVFYYAGPTRENNIYAQLNLNNNYFLVSEMAYYLSNIACNNQVILFDGGNMPIDSVHTVLKQYTKKYDERSTLFLGVKEWRQESASKEEGIFTGAILNYLLKENQDVLITAQNLSGSVQKKLLEPGISMPLQSHHQGYEIVLGRHLPQTQITDSSAPKIQIYNARILRGENIQLVPLGRETHVTGTITHSAGIQFAYINGDKLKVLPNGSFSYPKSNLHSDTIHIIAVNRLGKESECKAILQWDPEEVARSDKRTAWLIANDSFDNLSYLCNPVGDAEAIGERLKNIYGYELHRVYNKSKSQIEDALDSINSTKYSAGEQVFIFYASHGIQHPARGLLIAARNSESPDNSKKDLYISGDNLINTRVKRIGCNNVFLMMDLCYGGGVLTQTGIKYREYFGPVNPGTRRPGEHITEQKKVKCIGFAISGRLNPVANGNCIPGTENHSPFAETILRNLDSGANAAAYITLQDLRKNLPQTGTNASWRPICGYLEKDIDGDYLPADGEYLFEIVRKARRAQDIEALNPGGH